MDIKGNANLIFIVTVVHQCVVQNIDYIFWPDRCTSTGFRMVKYCGTYCWYCCSITNAGAYMAEIVRGGNIEVVDKGQIEAARSLGLTYGKTMKKIVHHRL